MNSKERIIISYINKFHTVNYDELQYELEIPKKEICDIIMSLYERKIIEYSGESYKYFVCNREYIERYKLDYSWDVLKRDSRMQIQNFNENILYIPKAFDKISEG